MRPDVGLLLEHGAETFSYTLSELFMWVFRQLRHGSGVSPSAFFLRRQAIVRAERRGHAGLPARIHEDR